MTSLCSLQGARSSDVDSCLKQMDTKVLAVITLKVGAQVMCLKNYFEEGLVNGSRGVVCDVDPEGPKIRWAAGHTSQLKKAEFTHSSGGVLVARNQIPLKLAWALSVHKSQGMTLERGEQQRVPKWRAEKTSLTLSSIRLASHTTASLNLSDAFEYGQAYVALSRVTGREGLLLCGPEIGMGAVRAHERVTNFYDMISRGYGAVKQVEQGGNEEEDDDVKVIDIKPERVRAGAKPRVGVKPPERKVRTCGHCALDNDWEANVCGCCGNVLLKC